MRGHSSINFHADRHTYTVTNVKPTCARELQSLSGPDYTFSWSWSGGPVLGIVAGCTSTSDGCGLLVANSDTAVTVTVTYSQGGQTASQSATAIIRLFCGSVLC
jgi:hypothetical protein